MSGVAATQFYSDTVIHFPLAAQVEQAESFHCTSEGFFCLDRRFEEREAPMIWKHWVISRLPVCTL